VSENEDVLVEALLQKHLPAPIRIDWDNSVMHPVSETTLDVRDQFERDRVYRVPASRIVIRFPIDGTGDMLKYNARTTSLSGTVGDVRGGELVLEITERELSRELVEARTKGLRDSVSQRVEWANNDLEEFRRNVDRGLRNEYEARKKRILADRALTDSLGIPARSTGNRPPSVPAQRKQVTLDTRRHQSEFVPEPVLEEAIYRDVVQATVSWARSLERTPNAGNKLGEEDLRDLLLGTLNSYWEGKAGGELFNGAGKTDVLVRHENRNVFIAECKVWRGPKTIAAALDQLLNYLVWRDSKAALLVFIRTANPAATIASLHTAVEQHPRHVLTKPDGQPHNVVDYILTADDEGRKVALAVIPVVLKHG